MLPRSHPPDAISRIAELPLRIESRMKKVIGVNDDYHRAVGKVPGLV
jgi:hypothetical protein